MDLHEFIRSRRSVRRFRPAQIDLARVERVIETAASAPSAHNRQPWRFAVLTRTDQKSQLAEAMAADFARDLAADGIPSSELDAALERSRLRITSAPVGVLLCMDMSDMDRYPDERRISAERTMAIQSVANSGATLLLAVHAEGLGGVWICGPLFAPQAVARALELPISWEPQALILIGEPATTPLPRPRRDLRDVVVFR